MTLSVFLISIMKRKISYTSAGKIWDCRNIHQFTSLIFGTVNISGVGKKEFQWKFPQRAAGCFRFSQVLTMFNLCPRIVTLLKVGLICSIFDMMRREMLSRGKAGL